MSGNSTNASKITNVNSNLTGIGYEDCRWTDGFWGNKFSVCKQEMLPYMEEVLTGDVGHALNNFKIAAGIIQGEHKGMFWHDGDFYKWMEAACLVYVQTMDPALLRRLDQYIDIIAKAQEEDGYIQTQIQLRDEVGRYENRKYHEMYNTGHLLISACTHYRIFNTTNFLNIAIKQADLLVELFSKDTDSNGRFGFNQTQIMGLVELFRVTDGVKYLKLAEKFINRRGSHPVEHDNSTIGYPIGDMVQERTPLRDSEQAVGHAVLALYYYAGAADVYKETGESKLRQALVRLWDNIAKYKMYVTGAVGQTHYGASINRDKIEEGFIDDYMLPNLTAYNETCANLCNAIFSQKMLEIEGKSKYADIMELVMYNSGLSGISLDGKKYFYANPLRMIQNAREYNDHENATETPDREPYLHCFCCPPNLVRTVARTSQWAYSKSEDGVAVIFYGANRLKTALSDGSKLCLRQETDYPWGGEVKIVIEECREEPFDVLLRIPGWSRGAKILINGSPVDETPTVGQFTTIRRNWSRGDVLVVNIEMPIEIVEGHPRVEEVRNHVAIKKGPIVYCVESPDLPKDTSILDVYFSPDGIGEINFYRGELGGVNIIGTRLLIREDERKSLYNKLDKPTWKSINVQLIPYFAWSNRGTAEMTVFLPVVWKTKS